MYNEETMISVVIPTMWKFRPFLQFLEDMLDSPAVGEVIIINNDAVKTPVDHVLSNPKVRMYDFGKNIYVNPAWNFGVAQSKFEMFFHRDVYIPIIDGLDLYWGDNFIYDTLFYKMNENYLITNCFYYSPNAQTTSTIQNANEILKREHIVYNTDMPAIINALWGSNRHRTGL